MKTVKFKIKILLSLLMVLAVLGSPVAAFADSCSCTAYMTTNSKGQTTCNGNADPAKVKACVNSTPIWKDIEDIVQVLSAGVAVVVTGVVILGGIQYTMAGGNPNALQAARQRITNGLIALFVFIFTYAFLQWLIPGGIFNK